MSSLGAGSPKSIRNNTEGCAIWQLMFILLEPRYIKLKVSAVGEAQQSQYTCGIGYSVLTPVRPATFSIYDIMHSGTRNPSHCTYLLLLCHGWGQLPDEAINSVTRGRMYGVRTVCLLVFMPSFRLFSSVSSWWSTCLRCTWWVALWASHYNPSTRLVNAGVGSVSVQI